MKDRRLLEGLPPEEYVALCRRVLEGLSELIEGEAHDDLEITAHELMGDRGGFRALCGTLAETIDLARECGAARTAAVDDASFRRCVELVRERLRQESGEGPK